VPESSTLTTRLPSHPEKNGHYYDTYCGTMTIFYSPSHELEYVGLQSGNDYRAEEVCSLRRLSSSRSSSSLSGVTYADATLDDSVCVISLVSSNIYNEHCSSCDDRRSAERRAAAPLLLGAGARRCRSLCPARVRLSSKPAALRSCRRTMGQTDGRTDGRQTVI